ncbi:hypothetical protein Tco_0872649 [Tanacetum coccineum]
MTTLAEHIIVASAENRPPMLEKSMYDSWASRIRLFIKGKKNGRMMLDLIDEGPLVYPMVVGEDGQTRPKKYSKLTKAQQIQDDCNVQATNIILHGLLPDVLYNLLEKFASIQGETLYEYYWRLSQLINDIHTIRMTMQQVQVNTKFLNALPPEWREDPIDYINKAMSFLSAVASRFPPLNNQLRMSSNPKNHATFKMEESQFNQFKEDKLKCTQPKRLRSSAWFKDKLMLVEAQEAAFQTEDLDAYDSDCDDISSAKAVLMANLSSYDSDVLSEVPYSDTYLNDMINQDVQEMLYSEKTHIDDFLDNEITSDSNIILYSQYLQESQDAGIQDTNSFAPNDLLVLSLVEQMTDHVATLDKENQTNKMVNESLTAELERYKERVAILEQRLNVDLNKPMHMLTKPQFFYDNTHKQALGYQNPRHLKKAQRIKPTLYDGSVIAKEHDVISVIDDEETLILEEESRSKMLDKQNDPISIKQKINISPIDYSKLNKIKEDFGKRFVTQKELSAEQAFWLKHSNYNPDTPVKSHTPIRIEPPSELPKVSLVNESLKKLKYHLASFDMVMKKRTTSDAISADAWGFEHTKACFVTEIIPFLKVLKDTFNAFDKTLLDEITEVQTVFNQMEAAID